MSVPERPRVFLVDDHHLFRSGVRSELGDAVEVVGEADDVAAAIELITERRPDVVLLDVHLLAGGGQAVVEAVKRAAAEVRFLALSVSDAPEDVITVIRSGARGYVTKAISGPELIDAVAGSPVATPCSRPGWRVSCSMPSRAPFGGAAGHRPRARPALPPRAGGAPAHRPRVHLQGVGPELSIAPKTVETHVSAVLRKLQLSTRHQLTRWATERRLV